MLPQALTERQREAVLASTRRVNIYDGSIRSGKTVASLIAWLRFVRHAPLDAPLLMAGKTERTLRQNVIDVLVEWLGEKRCRLVSGSGELWLLNHRVYLRGANDEKAEAKIRGLTLYGGYGDELTTWPHSFYGMLLGRLSEPGARLFGTTNPDSPNHWLAKKFLQREAELDLYRGRFRLTDNTFLDPEFVRNIQAEYVGLWRKRFIDGLWVMAEGAVYADAWDEERHVEDLVPDGSITRFWEAIDYGTAHPFVALLFGLGKDGRVHTLAEWRWDSERRMRQLSPSEYRERLDEWHASMGVRPEWVFIDPEEAGFRVELQRAGWRGVRVADNAVVEGIRLVSSLLARDRLRVHRSCEGLIEEIPGYVWDPKSETDAPVKMNDHSLDAWRYGLLSSEFIWERATRAA